LFFFKDSTTEQPYKTLCKINQNQYLNSYSNNSQNEMTQTSKLTLQKQKQQQKVMNTSASISSNDSTTLNGNKLKKSKSQNEVHSALIHDDDGRFLLFCVE
jgi:hypothetical protein